MIPGLDKVIILRYHITPHCLGTVLLRFTEIFRSFSKQWCFGREVSLSMKIEFATDSRFDDAVDIVFEFENINTFLSVEALREWFERIIFEYRVFTREPMENLMRFKCGSYHFIDTLKQREESAPFTVTVSFYDSEMNPESVPNPKINGIPICMKRVHCNMISTRCTGNTVNI